MTVMATSSLVAPFHISSDALGVGRGPEVHFTGGNGQCTGNWKLRTTERRKWLGFVSKAQAIRVARKPDFIDQGNSKTIRASANNIRHIHR